MLVSVSPKLPMRNKNNALRYYVNQLQFQLKGDYEDYIIVAKEGITLHFFLFKDLNPAENYGQVYINVNDIQSVYNQFINNKVAIHPNGNLQTKPWGQKEFALLDPDNNLLTFGETK